jgi:hypothetical protein
MRDKWWIGRDVEGKGSWPYLRHYPGTCLEGLRKTTKDLRQDNRSSGRDLNQGPPESEAGVLTTEPRRPVPKCCKLHLVFMSMGTDCPRTATFWYGESRWSDTDGKTEEVGKNLSHCHVFHHKSHMDGSGCEPGPPQWQAGDNGLRHDTANLHSHKC